MTIRKLLLLTLSAFTMYACSSTKFTKTGGSNPTAALTESTKTFILTPTELPPDNSIEVGDFEHLEDWNGAWDFLMEKIQKKARESGANIIKITAYFEGSKTKGHALLIRGKFYLSKASETDIEDHVKKERRKNVSNCNCSFIKVFRDEGNAALRALGKMDVVVNDSIVGPLTNKKAYSIKLTKESDVFIGTSQHSDFLVKNQFGNEYYVQATQVMSSPTPGTVMVGPKQFFLIESLKAKVHFETVENTYK